MGASGPIRDQIRYANQVTSTWPAWKRNILEHSMEPTNSVPRDTPVCCKFGCGKPASIQGYVGRLKVWSCEEHSGEVEDVFGQPYQQPEPCTASQTLVEPERPWAGSKPEIPDAEPIDCLARWYEAYGEWEIPLMAMVGYLDDVD